MSHLSINSRLALCGEIISFESQGELMGLEKDFRRVPTLSKTGRAQGLHPSVPQDTSGLGASLGQERGSTGRTNTALQNLKVLEAP